MDISLLYFDGCPNHHDTRASIEALLDEAGWDGTIQSVNVDSPERAEALKFRGSPTVLINGGIHSSTPTNSVRGNARILRHHL